MVRVRNLLYLMILLLMINIVSASEIHMSDSFMRQVELQLAFMDVAQNMNENIPMIQQSGHYKKPGLGVLMSAAVPGTGQMYAGSWLKGSLLLAAEIGLWTATSHYRSEGEDWEDKFHLYADTYWNEGKYWDQAVASRDPELDVLVTPDNYLDYLDELRELDETISYHTHSLPYTKTQQYYEMIGKYDQFSVGWSDEENYPEDKGRDYYEGMRHKSNQYFIKGTNCTMVILANHLFSALDAAWTIKRHNKQIDAKLKATMKQFNSEPLPFLSLELNW